MHGYCLLLAVTNPFIRIWAVCLDSTVVTKVTHFKLKTMFSTSKEKHVKWYMIIIIVWDYPMPDDYNHNFLIFSSHISEQICFLKYITLSHISSWRVILTNKMWCVPLRRSKRQHSTQTAEFLTAETSFSLKGKTFLHPYFGSTVKNKSLSISFP